MSVVSIAYAPTVPILDKGSPPVKSLASVIIIGSNRSKLLVVEFHSNKPNSVSTKSNQYVPLLAAPIGLTKEDSNSDISTLTRCI